MITSILCYLLPNGVRRVDVKLTEIGIQSYYVAILGQKFMKALRLNSLIAFTFLLIAPASADWSATPYKGQSKQVPKFIGAVTSIKAPKGLSDGLVAVTKRGDIRKAWYDAPTKRYGHGVIGDAVEAGGLVVETANGQRIRHELSKRFVFEDRYPRLVDLDGDGSNEIVTLRADAGEGAAVVIYGLVGQRLKEIAATPTVGHSNRWRNVAGLYDYDNDGRIDIMEVVTPHIGGILNRWSFEGGKLVRKATTRRGFSNHFIGSRALELSVSADFDGDGLLDLALPDASRRMVRVVRGTDLKDIAKIALPHRVNGDFSLVKTKQGHGILVPTKAGDFLIKHNK